MPAGERGEGESRRRLSGSHPRSRFPALLQSPLTDSNRRPPPYHALRSATGRNPPTERRAVGHRHRPMARRLGGSLHVPERPPRPADHASPKRQFGPFRRCALRPRSSSASPVLPAQPVTRLTRHCLSSWRETRRRGSSLPPALRTISSRLGSAAKCSTLLRHRPRSSVHLQVRRSLSRSPPLRLRGRRRMLVGVAGNGNSGCASPVHHEDGLWRPSAQSRIRTKRLGKPNLLNNRTLRRRIRLTGLLRKKPWKRGFFYAWRFAGDSLGPLIAASSRISTVVAASSQRCPTRKER